MTSPYLPAVASLWRVQFLRFLVIGTVNTAVGYLLFLAVLWTGMPYQGALAVSMVLSVLFSFVTTGGIVFENRKFRPIFLFFAGYAVVYGLNLVLLGALLAQGFSKAAGQAIALPVLVMFSFLVNKFVVFERAR